MTFLKEIYLKSVEKYSPVQLISNLVATEILITLLYYYYVKCFADDLFSGLDCSLPESGVDNISDRVL